MFSNTPHSETSVNVTYTTPAKHPRPAVACGKHMEDAKKLQSPHLEVPNL